MKKGWNPGSCNWMCPAVAFPWLPQTANSCSRDVGVPRMTERAVRERWQSHFIRFCSSPERSFTNGSEMHSRRRRVTIPALSLGIRNGFSVTPPEVDVVANGQSESFRKRTWRIWSVDIVTDRLGLAVESGSVPMLRGRSFT